MIEKFYQHIFLRLYHWHSSLFSIFLIASGYLIFNVTDAMAKHLSDGYSAFDIMFWSFLFSFITLLVLSYLSGFKKTITSSHWKWHILRGVFSSIGTLLVIVSLKDLTLANFYAIVFFSPIICMIFAKFFFNDALTISKSLAAILGFIGILIVVRPGIAEFSNGTWAALSVLLVYPLGLMIVRKIGHDEPKLLFGLVASAVAVIISLFLTKFSITIPSLDALYLLIFMGVFGALGGTMVSTAYQIAPSISAIAPFHYIQILGGITIGYLVWGDIPTIYTLIGSTIIIASGLWIIRIEKRQKHSIETDIGDTIPHAVD